jgi:hypothetical protein
MNWGFTGNRKSLKPRLAYLPGSVPAGASLIAALGMTLPSLPRATMSA